MFVYMSLADYNWHQGNSAYKNKQYPTAIERYTTALDYALPIGLSDLEDLYCDRGDAYDLNKELPLALSDYAEAIRRNPRRSRYYYERAIAWRTAKKYREAMADLDQAIRLSDGRPNYYVERAVCHYRLEEYKGAMPDFDKSLSMSGSPALTPARRHYAFEMRGNCQFKLNNLTAALDDFNQAIREDGQCGEVHYRRALVERALGKTAAADADVKTASALGFKVKN